MGYVGVSFWGGVFVALSGSQLGSTIAASIFMVALLICLRYSPNSTLIGICIGFIVVTLTFTLLEWFVFNPLLQFVTLFYGVFIGWYGIMDISTTPFLEPLKGPTHTHVSKCGPVASPVASASNSRSLRSSVNVPDC